MTSKLGKIAHERTIMIGERAAPTLLDCTFRDGGYYTKWTFSGSLTHQYLHAVKDAGISWIELGFRFPEKDEFIGPFGYTTDEYLSKLPDLGQTNLGVMVNASDLLRGGSIDWHWLNNSFVEEPDSTISFVRIAVHFSEMTKIADAINWLKAKGYHVFLNLMQVDRVLNKADELGFKQLMRNVTADVLYLADSFGCLVPHQIPILTDIVRECWSGTLGFHAHDNRGLAFANVLAAVESGITWIDGTLLGMGRGAGNVKTEQLVLEFCEQGEQYRVEPLFPLIFNDFSKLKSEYHWGENFFYDLSSKYRVHPTYIQELLNDPRCDFDNVIDVLEKLKSQNAVSFSSGRIEAAIRGHNTQYTGKWDATGCFKGREILILGSGPGLKTHWAAIKQFIESRQPVVLSLNVKKNIDPSLIDYIVACHWARITMEKKHYEQMGVPIIVPEQLLVGTQGKLPRECEVYDYGLKVEPGVLEIGQSMCCLPSSLAALYALCVANAGASKHIYLAGFDGYSNSDNRGQEMFEALSLYQQSKNYVPVTSITPTKYPLTIRSVYGPWATGTQYE